VVGRSKSWQTDTLIVSAVSKVFHNLTLVAVSNNCRRVLGIWFCFNGGSSYSGYGKVGVDRRFRIFNITEWGETITSYERTEHDEIVDKVVLVGAGGPAPYEAEPV
jgi:hypothetical protein